MVPRSEDADELLRRLAAHHGPDSALHRYLVEVLFELCAGKLLEYLQDDTLLDVIETAGMAVPRPAPTTFARDCCSIIVDVAESAALSTISELYESNVPDSDTTLSEVVVQRGVTLFGQAYRSYYSSRRKFG